jgi:alkaline phosphatase D
MNRFHLDRLLLTKVRRRRFLIGTGAFTGLAVASQWHKVIAQPPFSAYPFSLGVASGDPLPNSVVLWTRLAPEPLSDDGGMPPVNVPVQWQIADDENMRRIISSGTVIATPELGHSVHVEAQKLRPATWYWYRFRVGNEVSPIGRTRTLPGNGYRLDRLNFAFASCQNWEQGYFTAFKHMAQEDLDVVFHLGDYIYEGNPTTRPDRPRRHANPEPVDLSGYRIRHAQYRTDPDLQAVHAAFPFICTWDDHEVDNDYANEDSQDFDDPQAFLQRRAAAYQAYYEHLPLRPLSIPMGPSMRLYRRFSFGDLAEFSVLDTRQYRTDQACDGNGRGGGQIVQVDNCPELFDSDRTMLGAEQEQWLLRGLARSQTQWNVIAQQYLMAQLDEQPGPGTAFWTDGWDGYFAERARLLHFIQDRKISNPVVIGGDIHSFWVTDLKPDFDDPHSPVVASEFVGTSISSSGVNYDEFSSYLPDNPHIKFFESRLRGYVRCSIERQRWTSDLRVVDTVETPDAPVRTLATYVVESGKPGPQRV